MQNWILDGSGRHVVKSENDVFNLIRNYFDASILAIHDMVSVKPSTSSLQVLIGVCQHRIGSTDTYLKTSCRRPDYIAGMPLQISCQSLLMITISMCFIDLPCMPAYSNNPCKSRDTAFNTRRRHRLLIAKWKIKRYFKMHAGLLLNSNIRRILQGS